MSVVPVPEISLPEISVIVPVYNAAATLAATIASALAQTGVRCEVIAIDDGSRDDSAERLAALAAQDPRLRVVRCANGGVSAARNLGAELARAPLVAFLDADDLWAPDKLARHLAAHAARPDAVMSYARIAFIAPDAAGLDGALTVSSLCPHPPRLVDVLGENPVCTASNMVVQRAAFRACGGFDATLRHAEDQELVARLVVRGGHVESIDAVLTGYRLSPDGLSVDLAAMHDGWRRVAARYLDEAACTPLEALYCRYLARRSLRAGASAWAALRYVRAGLALDARAFLREPRRGLSTILAALAAPLLPPALRIRLFA